MFFAWTLSSSVLAPEKRLACVLLMTATRYEGGDGLSRKTTFTQTQLGAFGLGSRQRVGRLLQRLEHCGLVEIQYKQIIIPSMNKLDAFIYN